MTAPPPGPGWYPNPSDPATSIYWNGTAWSEPTQPASQAAEVVRSNQANTKNAVTAGVCVLVIVGLVMSLQSVSLITGSGLVWTGVALVAAGTAVAFFLGAAKWVRIAAAVVLIVSVGNAAYIEKQLSDRREQLTHMFGQ